MKKILDNLGYFRISNPETKILRIKFAKSIEKRYFRKTIEKIKLNYYFKLK